MGGLDDIVHTHVMEARVHSFWDRSILHAFLGHISSFPACLFVV